MKEDNKEFNKWRKRANKAMPGVAMRVFELRSKSYLGCGFHYDLEKRLGYCLRELNSYGEYPEWYNQILLQSALEDLFRQVVKIENEIKNRVII